MYIIYRYSLLLFYTCTIYIYYIDLDIQRIIVYNIPAQIIIILYIYDINILYRYTVSMYIIRRINVHNIPVQLIINIYIHNIRKLYRYTI